MLSKQKTVRDHETIKALWGKTKEIEIRLEDLRHDLSKNYSTKTDAREFIELTQKSIFDKLEGLEKLIAKITNSLEK